MSENVKRKFKMTKHLIFIKENTTDVEGIVDILIQEDVIPMCDRDSILKAHIPIKEQVQKVLDVVWKKQHELTFISALKDTGNQHVADRILSSALPDDILEFQEQSNMDVINTDGNLATKETKETLNLKKENKILKEENSSLMESSRKLLEENRLLKDEVERLKCLQKAVRDKSNKTYEKQQKTHRENVELKKSLEGCKAINPEEVDQMKAAINELRDKDNHKDEILASQDLQQKRQALEIQSLTDFQALMDSDIKRLRDEVESQKNENAQMKNELESIKEAEDAKKNKLVDTETQTHAHVNVSPRPGVAFNNIQKPIPNQRDTLRRHGTMAKGQNRQYIYRSKTDIYSNRKW